MFPACAGMYRTSKRSTANCRRVPRMRGDVPPRSAADGADLPCSPHARGCTDYRVADLRNFSVFPACAGMYRQCVPGRAVIGRVPRMRGDVPFLDRLGWGQFKCSPHARGCTESRRELPPKTWVVPACAGMYRPCLMWSGYCLRVPRMRGDVPSPVTVTRRFHQCSPHARGCTAQDTDVGHDRRVFPACAGMYRASGLRRHGLSSVPRMRGDVP